MDSGRRFTRRQRHGLVLGLLASAGAASLLLGLSPARADQIVIVSNGNPRGWEVDTTATSGEEAGGVSFVDSSTSAPSPPTGTGSLRMETGAPSPVFHGTHSIRNRSYAGKHLSDLTALEYSTFVTSAEPGTQVAPYIEIGVTWDTTNTPGTIIYEPAYDDPDVAQATWQRWNTLGDALWWSSIGIPGATCSTTHGGTLPTQCTATWDEIKRVQGDATIDADGITFQVGDVVGGNPLGVGDLVGREASPWDNFDGNIDNVAINTGAGATAYDFELVNVGPTGHDAFALGDKGEPSTKNKVWRFDLASPLTAQPAVTIGGFETAGEALVAIATHPETGDLYGVTTDDTTHLGRVYRIYQAHTQEYITEATTVAPFPLLGSHFGASFDPVLADPAPVDPPGVDPDPVDPPGVDPPGVDPAPVTALGHLLHVVSDADVHVAVSTSRGVALPQAPLAYALPEEPAAPDVVALAHGSGVLYGIDATKRTVVQIPQAGTLTSKGTFGANLQTTEKVGFDVSASGLTYGTFNASGNPYSRLYSFDPEAPSAATQRGRIGGPGPVAALALPDTGTVQFSAGTATESERGVEIDVELSRTGGSYGALTVNVADLVGVGGGTATPNSDYTFSDPQITWADGDVTPKTVKVTLLNDSSLEPSETVVLEVRDPRGVGNFLGATREFRLTITETTVAFKDATASVDEGDASKVLTVNRTGDENATASVKIDVTGGTATAGTDYGNVDETVVQFPDTDGTKNSVDVTVQITDDTDFEGASGETATFQLKDSAGDIEIATPSATTLTITEDSAGTVQFDEAPYEQDEGEAKTIKVTRTGGNEGAAKLRVRTLDTGTATPGTDFTAIDSLLNFDAANSTTTVSRNVSLTALTDALFEGDETVNLALTVESGSPAMGVSSAQSVIHDLTVGSAFLLTRDGTTDRLISFDPAAPTKTSTPRDITNLGGDRVVGIDFRPADGLLYAVTVGNNETRLYTINPGTSRASPVVLGSVSTVLGTSIPIPVPFPGAPALNGTNVDVDWDATKDVLRVASDLGEHLVFDPHFELPANPPSQPIGPDFWHWETGSPFVYTPGTLGAGLQPKLVGVAHDKNVRPDLVLGETPATAYAIDDATDTLVRIDPIGDGALPVHPATLTTIGRLGAQTEGRAGFDVTTDGRAFAALTRSGATRLYRVNLETGVASQVGTGPLGGGTTYTDLAFGPSGVIRFEDDELSTTITGEGGTTNVVAERVGGTFGALSVHFDATPGSATAADYSLTPGTLTFAHLDASTQTFALTITNDDEFEGDHTFDLVLSAMSGGGVFSNLGSSLTQAAIIHDDPVGTLAFASTTLSGGEDAGPISATVTRTGGVEGALTVDYETQQKAGGGAATPNTDYTPESGTLTFANGSSEPQSFDVAITADNDEEGSERFDLALLNPIPATTVGSPATVTITNDDFAGTLSLSAAKYTVDEDDGSATIQISRSGDRNGDGVVDTDGDFAVDFATKQLTAGDHTATAGSDYTTKSQRVTLAHGVDHLDVPVSILDDLGTPELEGDETLEVKLSNPTDFPDRPDELGTPKTATVLIHDAEVGTAFAAADTDADGKQELISFEVARPDVVTTVGTFTGLDPDERLEGLDLRSDGDLYALVVDRPDGDVNTARIALVDPDTAGVTEVGPVADDLGTLYPIGEVVGFDFDPVRDVLRLVDDDDQNLHLNVDPDAANPDRRVIAHEDDPLFYGGGGAATVAGSAYTPAAGSAATLYGIDSGSDKLVRQGDAGDPASADTGELTGIGAFNLDTTGVVGFDVDDLSRALATLTVGGRSKLYSITLANGAARHIGDIGGAALIVDAVTVEV